MKAKYKTGMFRLQNSIFILLSLLIPLGLTSCSSGDDIDGSDDGSGDSKGTHNGHEYVDLGLSVKWATCNVGASSVHDVGNYYQWGGTSTKSSYSSSNCDTYGVVLYDISGDEDYDVARAKWGGKWRMPTKDEVQELIDNCDVEYYDDGDEYGDYVFVGSNGNYIWMPLTGYYSGTELKSSSNAYLWTSTYYNDDGEKDFLYESTMFQSGFTNRYSKGSVSSYKRWYGAPLRPVFDDDEEEEEEYSYDVTETIDGYEAVDLGLSVKWARCNIGATDPWDYGSYYAYNETSTKTTYTESNYNSSGADTATQLWGEKWRLPTQDECEELLDLNLYNTSEDGINGMRVTNSTGNSIFLPAAGYKGTSYTATDKNLCGYYWTSTSKSYYYLYVLFFSSENATAATWSYLSKWNGFSVRPVTDY